MRRFPVVSHFSWGYNLLNDPVAQWLGHRSARESLPEVCRFESGQDRSLARLRRRSGVPRTDPVGVLPGRYRTTAELGNVGSALDQRQVS